MIVVVGSPAWNPGPPGAPAGRACAIALAAAARGSAVELVGRAGDDAAGDALLIELARARVGHIALLRDPARPTRVVAAPQVAPDVVDDDPGVLDDDDRAAPEPDPATSPDPAAGDAAPVRLGDPVIEPADVSLGLRYLTSFGVLVLVDDVGPDVLPVAVEAAAFAEAHLVVLVEEGSAMPEALPADATVLAAPPDDPDAAFATFVGAYAAALDGGAMPDAAFTAARGPWEAPSS